MSRYTKAVHVRLRSDRPMRAKRQRRILLGESLQPGDVGGERDVPVADHERRGAIDRRDRGAVPHHQRLAVDRRLRARRRMDAPQQRGDQADGGSRIHRGGVCGNLMSGVLGDDRF